MSKRALDSASASISSDNSGPNKRSRPDPSHLTSWLSSPSLQVPSLIASSSEIVDLDSVFIAHAASVSSAAQAEVFRRHVREQHANDEAGHEMMGWRCLIPKAGKDGSGSEMDWMLKSGQDDDGEKWSGEKIVKVMESESKVDVCVVVSRWFGGTLLGPRRFKHIESATRQALANLDKLELEHQSLSRLQSLDKEVQRLCEALSKKGVVASPGKQPDYSGADMSKMQRLISAREKRIQLLKGQLDKADS